MESIKPASIKLVLIKKYFYQDIKAEADTGGDAAGNRALFLSK